MKNCKDRIENKIGKMPKGTVFSNLDFLDICSYNTVNKTIQRFIQDNMVKKIIKGIYYKPKYNKFLKEDVEPSPNDIANTIAKNFGWTIVPEGDTALNILGLSSQVPSVWTYVSDGRYKTYKYKNTNILFKRTTNRNISKMSYKTALIIQALKALGKDNINNIIVNKIKNLLTTKEKQIMLNESIICTSWIFEKIRLICEAK